MTLTLYAHPFSSYCQKALIALYENGTPFEYRMLDNEQANAELAALWPIRRFPILVDDGCTIVETSIIIEHLDLYHPGLMRLVPEDARVAIHVRMMDRFFDNYIMTPVQRIVSDSLRSAEARDPQGVAGAREMLDRSYDWLDRIVGNREWAGGQAFSLADCAAAPSLFYADWVHPVSERFASLKAYRRRLLARPSFARAVDEARPYRHLFPLGAPDRD
jgi:glutathione S-transferase